MDISWDPCMVSPKSHHSLMGQLTALLDNTKKKKGRRGSYYGWVEGKD